MMNQPDDKKAANLSSMVDLKAELFRKKEEFNRDRIQNAAVIKGRTFEKKPTIWSKKNAGVLQRAQRDMEDKVEEEDTMDKSKRMLEAKARLYEKMATSNDIPEEDGSMQYLVDFQKKAIDNILEHRKAGRSNDGPHLQTVELEDDIPPAETPDEEWVDFVDSLGRSRRCLRKDLIDLQNRDQEMKNRLHIKPTPSTTATPDNTTPELLSNDMKRELQRQEWEREELEAMSKPIGPVHYADVMKEEIRAHGVGFYQFSQDEEARTEQQETLSSLRQQTVEQRDRRERIKEKRRAMLDARLSKVKQRKIQREGGEEAAESVVSKDAESDGEDDVIGAKLKEIRAEVTSKQAETKLQEREVKPVQKKLREWDVGKKVVYEDIETQKARLESERPVEFAPPSAYFDDKPVNAPPRHTHKGSQRKKCAQPNIADRSNWEFSPPVEPNNSTISYKQVQKMRMDERLKEGNFNAASVDATFFSQDDPHQSHVYWDPMSNLEYVNRQADNHRHYQPPPIIDPVPPPPPIINSTPPPPPPIINQTPPPPPPFIDPTPPPPPPTIDTSQPPPNISNFPSHPPANDWTSDENIMTIPPMTYPPPIHDVSSSALVDTRFVKNKAKAASMLGVESNVPYGYIKF